MIRIVFFEWESIAVHIDPLGSNTVIEDSNSGRSSVMSDLPLILQRHEELELSTAKP